MKQFVVLFFLFCCYFSYAQVDTLTVIKRDTIVNTKDTLIIKNYYFISKVDSLIKKIAPPIVKVDSAAIKKDSALAAKDTVPKSNWTKENKLGLSLTEVAFVNWNAGGNNSFSAISRANFVRKYKTPMVSWNNELRLSFGLNAQEGRELRKTDDRIEFNSTAGFKRKEKSSWYHSAKFNFRTQFSNGYKYPDTDNPISRLMAPGYLFIGIGAEYIEDKPDFNLYISPLTQKSTFVLDQGLADKGAFGVQKAKYDMDGNLIQHGKNIYTEVGILITNSFKKEISKNMNFNNRLNLYTDYLNSFGNVDIDWEMLLDLTVNEYVKANIGTHIIYDNDVKFKESETPEGEVDKYGARIQLKQLLGVGISYSF
ncbi:Protein of unknown function [Zhouia amylolytica]|uniref:DUF3078 domain-containing protein n=2 Tax=Zhouia amylolytica TaxID=376730 RepID=W2ULZ5_9FLAO|nr:DUF3078 domain-containing protein [Zhouia amylolytica]ETN94471.1 hypothetical protein P278_24140 [Zhouia amylolytica AD3]MCQ0110307.1 DUF3078 domain-containing protein [Zhouia amylolytica]SFT12519.1 Protein of unknown function [Zhouia amylolytica]